MAGLERSQAPYQANTKRNSRVFYNMYKSAKFGIKLTNNSSNNIKCNIGVNQGDNLSPVLFAQLLNDSDFILSTHYRKAFHEQTLKLSKSIPNVMIYAETSTGSLQKRLDHTGHCMNRDIRSKTAAIHRTSTITLILMQRH